MKKIFLLFILVLIGYPSFLYATNYTWSSLTDFKEIDQFNLFLKQDLQYYLSDVQGRVAVGGDANLKSFAIGLNANTNEYSLIVKGNLTAGGLGKDSLGNYEGGQVNNGGIYVGGDVQLQRVGLPTGNIDSKGNINLEQMTVENGDVKAKGDVTMDTAGVDNGDVQAGGDVTLKNLTVHGDVKAGGKVTLDNASATGSIIEDPGFSPTIDDPFDFDVVDLINISNALANSTNGNIYGLGTGSLTFECTNPLVCYFNISASDLETAGLFTINAPNDRTVVINVTGDNSNDKDLNIDNMGFNLIGGIQSTNILYNLMGFESITMHNIGLPGSILAPNAEVNFYEGHIIGTLMADSLIGGSWTNKIRGGQINTPTPVPEASTGLQLMMMLILFISFIFFSKKLATINELHR